MTPLLFIIIINNKVNPFRSCDVTDREKIMQLADKIRYEVGNVSILVNNAGIMPTRPLMQQNEAEIKKTFDINVFAHFWVRINQFSSVE